MSSGLRFLVYIYKVLFSVHTGGACRFHPSCSDYALQAIDRHPPINAVKLIARRLSSCRPGGRFGFDPVPTRLSTRGMHE